MGQPSGPCKKEGQVNHATHKDSYPLPNIEDTFAILSGADYFCSLDLASGYWQVAMDDSSKQKTAFNTHEGLCQYKVMPFGFCNVPATFERLMDKILRGMVWKRCMCYLEDIVVFGKTFLETLEYLKLSKKYAQQG